MILKGNARGGSKDLALHLMKAENERVELHELRGVLSRDLMGALNEMYAVSRGTMCRQFMYSLSLNPPRDADVSIADFEQAIEDAEQRIGLQGQARAIVFHVKNGRRHCHVVWSRIDLQTMTARQIPYDRLKLQKLSRELFLRHDWQMPKGLENSKDRDPTNYDHAEYQQAKRAGKDAAQIKRDLQDAWANSDSRQAFEAALLEKGYILARGDTGRFVVTDHTGEVWSLPKQLGIKTKEVRAKIGDEADLPDLEQVREKLAQMQPEKAKDLTAQEALDKITHHHAAFTLPMMDRTLKPLIKDITKRKAMIEQILSSKDIIKLPQHDGQDVFTTPEMQATERTMMQTAQAMEQTSSHRRDVHAVNRAVFNLNAKLHRETGGKAQLSDQQIKTLHHMTSEKQLSLVVGVAGAGKTTIMQAAKDAMEAQGYRVFGAAPSGIAASGLKDIGMTASMLHSLEARIDLAKQIMDGNTGRALTKKQLDIIQFGTLTSKDVLIVDEVGMVGTNQLARIIDLTHKTGAKLILVGDPEQLQPINAGMPFRDLVQEHAHAKLTEVRRQKTDWQREATQDFARQQASQALQIYERQGHIHRAKTRDDVKAKLVADMMTAHVKAPDKNRLVLAYTRADVADLNAMIKVEMIRHGKVQPINTTVSVTVHDGNTEYEQDQGFAIGDRILFRKNDRDLGVMNGSFGTLQQIEDDEFIVALDNGKQVTFSPQEYKHLQLGYAATVHKSQGITVDETYVLASPHFDRHTTYVAMNRHKDSVNLYASKEDFKNTNHLHRMLGRSGDKLSTQDVQPRKQPELQREPSSLRQSITSRARNIWKKLRGKTDNDRMHQQPAPAPQYLPDQSQPKKPLTQEEYHNIHKHFIDQAAPAHVQKQLHRRERGYEKKRSCKEPRM